MFRILVFALVLFALRVVVGFLFGASDDASGISAVQRYLAEYFLDSVVVVAVFARLATLEVASPWKHAFIVVVLEEAFGSILSVAVFREPVLSPSWMFDYPVLLLSLSMGVWIGTKIAHRDRGRVGDGV